MSFRQALKIILSWLRLLKYSEAEIKIFRLLCEFSHKSGSWESHDSPDPACWLKLSMIAREATVNTRTVTRALTRFSEDGLIERRQGLNGFVGRCADGAIHGISLGPVLAHFSQIAAAVEAHHEQTYTAQRLVRELRRELSQLRRALVDAVAAGVAAATEHLTTIIDIQTILKRIMAGTLGTVANWTKMRTAVSFFETLLTAVGNLHGFTPDALENGLPESEWTDDLSGGSDKMSDLELQRGRVSKDSNNVEGYVGDATPPTPGTGKQNTQNTPENRDTGAVTGDVVALADEIGTADWQAAAAQAAEYGHSGAAAMEATALLLAGRLRIQDTIWLAAAQRMGLRNAFIALLMLDRNRHRATNPIRSVGGALRALTSRWAEGTASPATLRDGIDAIRWRIAKKRESILPVAPESRKF
ncbi:MAG: hypothetical protein OXD33_00970 [Rhodobacteraceae bacterium]|nr:hypothetical protein [Paracoccaceae bacterium]